MAAAQVVCGSRLARLVNELPQPSVQLPQVVFFMGRNPKNKALRQLCSSNYRGQCHSQPGVNIRSDNRTLQALQDIIISRLIFLFTDVVCVFADDVGGFEGTRRLLTTWAAIGSASSLPPAVRPRVIVVVSQSPSATGSVIDEDDFLFELLHAGDVQELSSDARYMALGSDISRQLRNSRVDRERYRCLFSATHLNAFFELAVQNISTSPFALFDFVRSTRERNPLDGAFASHITNFLKVGSRTRTPYDEMASHIASAILMDAYPPGMHHFLPSMVYRTLYHDPCYTGLRKFYSTDALASVQSERIQQHLSQFFEHMASNLGRSSEIHKSNLEQQRKFWTWLSQTKPVSCVLDATLNTLRHVDMAYATAAWRSLASRPFMMNMNTLFFSASSAGTQKDNIGSELPLADLIDLKVGTSSGGLYVIAMDILRMGPSEFKRIFQDLAKKVFGPDRRKGRIRSLLSDETYDTKTMENQYKDVFGSTRRLFDAPATLLSHFYQRRSVVPFHKL
ncbi:hypothetical protein ABHI18_012681 [Aspergillus niger]